MKISTRFILVSVLWLGLSIPLAAQRQMENLNRGLAAVKLSEGTVFIGWRLFGTDPPATAFNLYRVTGDADPVKVNDKPIREATNFLDRYANPEQAWQYYVRPLLNNRELAPCKSVRIWEQNYLEIPIQSIPAYRPGDASVAYLDGNDPAW